MRFLHRICLTFSISLAFSTSLCEKGSLHSLKSSSMCLCVCVCVCVFVSVGACVFVFVCVYLCVYGWRNTSSMPDCLYTCLRESVCLTMLYNPSLLNTQKNQSVSVCFCLPELSHSPRLLSSYLFLVFFYLLSIASIAWGIHTLNYTCLKAVR